MKRLILAMLVLGLVGYATMEDGTCPLGHRLPGFGRALRARAVAEEQKAAERAAKEAERARRDAVRALADARRQADEAAREAKRNWREAVREAEALARESVADVPVPIVPGTRVVDAAAVPPALPSPPRPSRPAPSSPDEIHRDEIHKAVGRPSATEDRAKADARRQLREDVLTWLESEVGRSWRPSERQLDAMVLGVRISPEAKPYATVYTAEIDADFSASRRDELIRSHRQAVVRDRIFKLAALLGFVLICLAVVSGYIRTDEATKGYYTNRLRMLAAAGVGAAGVAIYQMIA